jgi:aspartate aminotransferase
MIPLSATLAINERIEARRAAGEPVLHLGFGEARLPVPPAIAAVLAQAAPRNRYAPVTGTAEARAAAAGYFTRRGLPTGADQIVLAPGSKPLLYALIAALPGDVVLPRPSWVSYAAQAALAGRRVVWVDTPGSAGGVPDPERLDETLHAARYAGQRPGVLVLTLPDNPTGTLASGDLVTRVCAVAEQHDLAVVSDEIYRDLAYESGDITSPATLLPERTFVTAGLSKNMALGGWRIGFARFPAGSLGESTRREVVGVASEVWSSLADPMQEVAAYVLDEPPEVVAHVADSRRLHRCVTQAVQAELVAAGAECRAPGGAFYVYPDLAPLSGALARRGVTSGAELADHLLEQHGVGVLAGQAFGDDPSALRFRVATSMLHGSTDDERREALHSPDPVALPWIEGALGHLRTALRDLAA